MLNINVFRTLCKQFSTYMITVWRTDDSPSFYPSLPLTVHVHISYKEYTTTILIIHELYYFYEIIYRLTVVTMKTL